MFKALTKPFASLAGALSQPAVWVPLVLVLVLVVLGVGGYFLFGSWLVAVIVALALALVVLVAVLLRTLFGREREERLGRGIDDRGPAEEAERFETSAERSMEEDFRRAVAEIRTSRLGAGGVEALPWLLVMGEAGGGKSALLRVSGLELPAEYVHSVGIGPTRSCEWWLANQAIVLDTAGRFLDSDDDTTRGEWRVLVRNLRRHRPRCGVNGILFCLPVTSLLGKSQGELEEMALRLRRCINELQDRLALDFPVYLLVTKADLIEGFVETAALLPGGQLREALGWTNDRRHFPNSQELVEAGLGEARDRLEALLPELLLREQDPERRRRVFAFPQELDAAIRAVAAFAGRAFAPSAYDEVPFLRGVYFTSSRREGTTVSPQLHRLGHDWARNRVDGSFSEGGIFVRDLFQEVVIGDRDLAVPIETFGPRQRRLVHLAAGFVALFLAAWWTLAFVQNLSGILRLRGDAVAVVKGASDLENLERLRSEIEGEARDFTVLRRGGLGGSLASALDDARGAFVFGFGREYEVPTKRRLQSTVRGADDRAFEALAQLATDVTWMATRADPEDASRPDLVPYAPVSKSESEVLAFRKGYDDFVRWLPEEEVRRRIADERDVVASASARLLELARLESWSDHSEESYPPARYADDGLPDAAAGEGSRVPGAYTRRGWEGLVQVLIDAVDRTGGASSTAVNQFRRGYVSRYDARWRSYLLDAPTPAVASAEVKQSPYLALVDQIRDNTSAELPREEALPPWIRALREVRRETPEEPPPPAEGEEPPPPPPPPPWQRYQAALDQVAADVAGSAERGETALELAVRMADDQQTSFGDALALVRQLVPSEGDPVAIAKLREILSMPILNGASSVLSDALGELDRRWRDRIAIPFAGSLNTQEMQALYGGSGELAKFRDEALGRFYQDGRARSAIADRSMPFGPDFLAWMKSAEHVQKSLFGGGFGGAPRIAARLEGIPSRVTGGQPVTVARRVIRLACSDGVQAFIYNEGVGSQAFQWSPDCTELSLRIWALDASHREIELLPRLEWSGPLAFPDFLHRAQRRSDRRFLWTLRYQEPEVELAVEYRLRGGDGILAITHRAPPVSMRN
jgi:hypothetical protein